MRPCLWAVLAALSDTHGSPGPRTATFVNACADAARSKIAPQECIVPSRASFSVVALMACLEPDCGARCLIAGATRDERSRKRQRVEGGSRAAAAGNGFATLAAQTGSFLAGSQPRLWCLLVSLQAASKNATF